MTHSDRGNYAAKHGEKGHSDGRITAALAAETAAGACDCARAERVAAELAVTMEEVGRTLDLQETRIGRCQLGLFGHPEGQEPSGKVVRPAAAVDGMLAGAIRAGLVGGKLPCRVAWEIAAALSLPRMAVSAACETLQLRVKPCQLGAF